MLVTKIFRFEACHSVKDAYTCRCDRTRTDKSAGGLHGHSYVVELTLEGDVAKSDGMVIDFTLVRETFNHIIDAFDHTLVIGDTDKVMATLGPYISARYIIFPGNPTAENMAEYFFNYLDSYLTDNYLLGVSVFSVTVWETVTGKATKVREIKGVLPSDLYISPALAYGWSDYDKKTFEYNNGHILEEKQLITNITTLDTTDSAGTTLNFTATLGNKNC
jgi:6-pyruvoyltetrahydropterin/6-carboxytetrahydropterin synthase